MRIAKPKGWKGPPPAYVLAAEKKIRQAMKARDKAQATYNKAQREWNKAIDRWFG